MKSVTLIIGGLLTLLLASDASACHRCGLFGNRCRFVSHKPTVVVQAAKQDTTIVNNLIGIPVPVQYTEPIALQGTTVFGYDQFTQAYSNNVDMGLLYNQAARLTDQAQQLAGQAATDFSALVQSEGYNRTEVAKILAQGQAAGVALRAVNGGQPQNFQRNFSFKVTQTESGEIKIEKVEEGEQPNRFQLLSDRPTFEAIVNAKCIGCHNSGTASGGLNLEADITQPTLNKIWLRVTSLDPNKLMPKSKSGPPIPLPAEELETIRNIVSGL